MRWNTVCSKQLLLTCVYTSAAQKWVAVSLMTLAAMSFATDVCAQDTEDPGMQRVLTGYGGYRDGGSFISVTTNQHIDIQGAASGAISFDFPLDESRQYQVFFSYQDSVLKGNSTLSPTPFTTEVPLQVMYLHVGGTNYFGGNGTHGGYVAGGLGVTFLDPSETGYSSELRASASLSIGFSQPIGKRLALRVEARGYFTLINSAGGLFCNGGSCTASIKGQSMTQGELLAGLSFRL
jgi:hypothetical protein